MRNFSRQSWAVVMVLAAAACGSNDDSGSSESPEGSAGISATVPAGGKTGSAGSTVTARAGTGAAGTKGATTPAAGSSAGTQPGAAGKSGSGAAGAASTDDDAGVPEAGSGGSAAAGSGGHSGGHSAGGAAAAGSGGATAAGSGATGAAGGGGSSASAATFTQVYALLSTGCAGGACHVNATVPGGMLSMTDKATAYKNLVNANATQCAGEKRVVPNDPAKSELVASLKHTQVGSCARTPRMPEGKAQWKDSDIAVVTSWIEAGAQDN